MVLLETHILRDDNEQHINIVIMGGLYYAKNKLEDAVFTAIMATVMVYGMIIYNVALNTGKVDGTTFLAATHELIFMAPIAFILEFL